MSDVSDDEFANFDEPSTGKRKAKSDHEHEDDQDDFQRQILDIEMDKPAVFPTSTPLPSDEQGQYKKRRLSPNSDTDDGPAMTFVQPQAILDKQDGDDDMYVKTMNVKELCLAIQGCCSVPGIDFVLLSFDTSGMEFYVKPRDSPSVVIVFFNKEMFTEYRVSKPTRKILDKNRLDSLKKRINKEVEYIEITSCKDHAGYTFSGYRIYKTGGKCKFNINIADNHYDIKVIDLAGLNLEWHLRISSQKFKDNVDFIDDSNDFIRITVLPTSLEFQGIRNTGHVGETIDQETEAKIQDPSLKFEALFDKKMLKIITVTKDLNKSLNMSFVLDHPGGTVYPVHFCYPLCQNKPQSHFSAYLLPWTTDE